MNIHRQYIKAVSIQEAIFTGLVIYITLEAPGIVFVLNAIGDQYYPSLKDCIFDDIMYGEDACHSSLQCYWDIYIDL